MGVEIDLRYDNNTINSFECAIEGLNFRTSPKNLCWFLPSLGMNKNSKALLNEWENEYRFPIIFNVRDPRDVLLSFVEYLSGATKHGIGNYFEYQIYSKKCRQSLTSKIESLLQY